MSRKVTVEVKIKLTISADEGVSIADFVNEMGYEFVSNHDEVDILDTEVLDHEVTDSK